MLNLSLESTQSIDGGTIVGDSDNMEDGVTVTMDGDSDTTIGATEGIEEHALHVSGHAGATPFILQRLIVSLLLTH